MYTLKPYDDSLREILDNGIWTSNKRTGIRTKTIFGMLNRYRIDKFFPVLSRRKYTPSAIFKELLWFISGSTNVKDLQKMGCHIWDQWEDREFEKKNHFEEGSLGPVYGFQLRHFGGQYGDGDICPNLFGFSGSFADGRPVKSGWGGTDQLAYVIRRINEDPSCRRILFSLWNPKDISQQKLPPCFLAGTKVDTISGQKNIESIIVGEQVYTQFGIEKVNEKFTTKYNGNIFTLKTAYLRGVPVKCTPDHPFLIYKKAFVKAKYLTTDDFIGISINDRSEIPEFNKTSNPNSKKFKLDNPDQWYMIGVFLGDGWVIRKSNKVSFAINDDQVDRILPRLRKVIKISPLKRRSKNVVTYQTASVKWGNILKTLGHKAPNKLIPAWIANAPVDMLKHLMDGYTDSDGYNKRRFVDYTTTSEALALGIAKIAWKLGNEVVSIYRQKRKKKTIIEGRIVNQKDTFRLKIAKRTERKNGLHKNGIGRKYIIEDGKIWLRIEEINIKKYKGDVFNLSVENDHTYIANNFITHNCHLLFQIFIDDHRRMSGMLTQRSADFPIGVPANIQFYSALIYMIAQQTGYSPYELIHSTANSHIYEDQIPAVEEYLKTPIVDSPRLILLPAKDIYSYTPDNFKLHDFKCGPSIKIPVAI